MTRLTKGGIGLAGLAALLVALSGCSGATSSSSDDKGPSKGQVVVWDTLSAGWPQWKDAAKQADKAFEAANPGVTVKRVYQPSDTATFNQLVQSAFRTGKGPDVLLVQPSKAGVLSLTDGLAPLDNLLSKGFAHQISGLDASTQDGKIYGIPTGLQSIVLYYNKEIFQKAGLDPSNPPKTYDQLLAAGKKLQSAGYTGITGGNKEGEINGWMYSLLWPGVSTKPFGVSDKTTLTDNTSKTVLEKYKQLVDAKIFTDGMQSIPLSDYEAEFKSGKSGMILSLATNGGALSDAIGADKIGVIQSPGITSDAPSFLGAVPALEWSVPKASKVKGLAAKFIESQTGAENAERLYTGLGWLPTNTTVKASSSKYPVVEQMVEQFQNTKIGATPPTLWSPAVATEFKKQVQLYITGDQSLEDTVNAVQAVADKQ